MARTALTKTNLPSNYATAGVAVTYAAADVSNGNNFVLTGADILLAYNSDSAPHTVTITSAPDSSGRTGDITTESIAAGATHVFEKFPVSGWAQSDGTLSVNASDATVKFAVLHLTS